MFCAVLLGASVLLLFLLTPPFVCVCVCGSAMADTLCTRIELVLLQLVHGLTQRPRRVQLTIPDDAQHRGHGHGRVLSFGEARTRRSLCCVVRVLALLYRRAAGRGPDAADAAGMTKRGVFYADKGLFRDQRLSDRALERATRLLGIDRPALRVFASPRGFVAGDLALELCDGSAVACGTERECLVRDDWCGRIARLRSRARCVVVVEKHSFFHELVRSPLVRSRLPACLFATSCGYPVRAVKELVATVCATLRLPCVVLVDFDPYGVDIFLKYRQVLPAATLGGLHADDVALVPAHCRLPLSPADAARGAGMLPALTDPCCIAAVRHMLQCQVKLELEAVHESDELLLRIVQRIARAADAGVPDEHGCG